MSETTRTRLHLSAVPAAREPEPGTARHGLVERVLAPPSAPRHTAREHLTGAALTARAAYALRANAAGSMTRAAPDLYPHQWSWDAAFVSVGIAHLDARRATAELDHLLTGQWSTGMVPHIVFDPAETGYFPGPDRWSCAELTDDAPRAPRTSGICQPPVHALAVERIVALAQRQGPEVSAHVEAWLPGVYRRLLAWHRYLVRERDPLGTGLLATYHGWEGGMDNSPRWDGPYSRVEVGADLPPYTRRDTRIVTDLRQRPTQLEYDRYLQSVEELKRAGYDDRRIRDEASYLVTDVFMSAVLSAASAALARLAHRLARPRRSSSRATPRCSRRASPPASTRSSGWRSTPTCARATCSWPRRSPGSLRCCAAASAPRRRPRWWRCCARSGGPATPTCAGRCCRPPARRRRPSGPGPTGAGRAGRW